MKRLIVSIVSLILPCLAGVVFGQQEVVRPIERVFVIKEKPKDESFGFYFIVRLENEDDETFLPKTSGWHLSRYRPKPTEKKIEIRLFIGIEWKIRFKQFFSSH